MSEQLTWQTEKRKVRDIIPADFNPRKRNEEKQGKLAESIDYFGQVDTLVINLDNGLISGERRLEVYVDKGLLDELLDVRVPSRMLTEEEVKKYMLLANTHAGEWDLPKLEAHFSGLYEKIVDLPTMDTALPSAEMLTKEKDKEREVVEDEFNDLPSADEQAITKVNDLYEIGRHRLICGDGCDVNIIGRLMNGEFADMGFIDPPYNLSPETFSGFGGNKTQTFEMGVGEMTEQEFIEFLEGFFRNMIRYSKPGSIHYVCMDWKHVLEIRQAGKLFSEFKNMIVWNKNNGGMGSFYRSKHELIFLFQNNQAIAEDLMPKAEVESRIDAIEQTGYEEGHELIFIFKNGKERNINNFMLGETGRYRTNVWDYPGASSFNKSADVSTKDHPTPKPLKLVGDAIMDCSYLDAIVTDFCLGSGSTLMACEQTDRTCYGSDISPAYCDLIVRRYCRYMKLTGKPIEILKNGKKLTQKELKDYGI